MSIFIAPERLKKLVTRQELQQQQIVWVVFDQFGWMVEDEETFRPDSIDLLFLGSSSTFIIENSQEKSVKQKIILKK